MTPEKSEYMQVPKFKYEANITTLVSIATLISMVGGVFYMTGQTREEINGMKFGISERYGQISLELQKTEVRLQAAELDIRRIDKMEYRILQQEKITGDLASLLSDMKDRQAEQGSDIRIIRDTVKRLDAREIDAQSPRSNP